MEGWMDRLTPHLQSEQMRKRMLSYCTHTHTDTHTHTHTHTQEIICSVLTFADCRHENNETRFDFCFFVCSFFFFSAVSGNSPTLCVCLCAGVCVGCTFFISVCACVCVCVCLGEREMLHEECEEERERERRSEACSLGGVMQARILVLVAMATGF